MIYLPGFTASPAEEVKSRHYAFKVYHTGTTFYFAAECGEDLGGWVESFGRVTVSEEEQCKEIDSFLRVLSCFSVIFINLLLLFSFEASIKKK